MQTEQFLCWSGMTDTEHSTTSRSNEEDQPQQLRPEISWQHAQICLCHNAPIQVSMAIHNLSFSSDVMYWC